MFSFLLVNVNNTKATEGSAMHGKDDSIQDFPSSPIILPTVTLPSGTDWYIQTRKKWLSLMMVVTATSIPVNGIPRQLKGNAGKYAGVE